MPKNPTYRKPIASVVLLALVMAGTFAAAGALAQQLRVSKMGGDIDYADVPDGGTFSTMGGNVHLGKVHNDITISTMGGNISIDSADASVKASTMGGNIESTLIKSEATGGHAITLSSMGGEIILNVPKNYPMTIDVDLTYTKGNEQRYRISEKLGLEQTATQDWDYVHGSPRKHLYAKGRTGDGRNHVTIKTINGNVVINGERSQL